MMQLVAEDLKEMLQEFNYEVPGIADTGEIAITLADEYHPNLVLMDINLAGEMELHGKPKN
jgi:DNA-binding NarL/FixJ family response regulator